MKFVDLKKEFEYFEHGIKSRWVDVTDNGVFFFGDQTDELESNMCKLSGNKNAVSTGNCTDAIMMVLKSIICEDVGSVDMPVILPNFGAYPTAVAVHNITDNVHYVDVKDDFTIDTWKLPDIRDGIIIPVHLFGNLCNMDAIIEYAKANNHIIIEDCAQAAGLRGTCRGDYSVFSFYPTKNLASMGDGGCICSDQDLSEIKKLRFYGQHEGSIEEIGVNSRMDEFQAAVVNTKFDKLDYMNNERAKAADFYGGSNKNSVWHQYPVLYKNRKKVIEIAENHSIPYLIHYSHHMPDFTVLRGNYNEVGNRISDKILSVPINPFMTGNEVSLVARFLTEAEKYEDN